MSSNAKAEAHPPNSSPSSLPDSDATQQPRPSGPNRQDISEALDELAFAEKTFRKEAARFFFPWQAQGADTSTEDVREAAKILWKAAEALNRVGIR